MTKRPFKNYGRETGIGQTTAFHEGSDYAALLDLGKAAYNGVKNFIFGSGNDAPAMEETIKERIRLATSEQIGKILRKYGGRPGKVNLGAYVPETDEIFVNPDSWKYGHDPRQVLGHEIGHRNGITDERAADEYGSAWARQLLQAA